MMELRKDIVSYEGLYKISNLGRVQSFHFKDYILKTFLAGSGYEYIVLSKNKHKKHFTIHRLVADAFIPNPENKPQVNHKNGIKTDNSVDNLERVTRSENAIHSSRVLGNKPPTMTGRFGKDNPSSKKVNQYTTDGEFIKQRDSVADVKRELGLGGGITACCTGKRPTMYGFIWKYI